MTLDDLEALAKACLSAASGIGPEVHRCMARAAYDKAASPDVILDLIRRVREAERAKDGYFAALWLCAEETAFVRTEWDRSKPGWERDINLIYPIAIDQGLPPRLVVQCGDTFAYACADGEDCEYTQAADVLTLMKAEGWPGVVRWCQSVGQRGEPIEPVVKAMATVDSMRAERDTALARLAEVERERDAQRADGATFAERSAWEDRDSRALMHRRAQAAESRATKAERANATLQVRLDGAIAKLASERPKDDVEAESPETKARECTLFSAGACLCPLCLPSGAWHRPDEGHAAPGEGGRMMDDACARDLSVQLADGLKIVMADRDEAIARAEAAESKLALVRDLALSGERSSWRRDVLAILGGE